MKKVTIVVPFYNVGSYIGDCLDSILKQTHNNIEILCIDDCSTDNSLAIVETYAVKDRRIKTITHTENKGRGAARNTGILHANSNYICFIDSDDYVSDMFVESLYKAIKIDNSDIAVCNYLSDENGLISPYGVDYENDCFIASSNKDNTLEIAMRFNPGCTNKIYKRDLLIQNNIFQPEKHYYEDVIFWLMAVYYSSKISVISDRLYYYRQRSNSIMNTLNYKLIDDRFIFIRQIDGFVKKNIIPNKNINISKIKQDTILYILIHIHYGESLVKNANIENKKEMKEYYINEIARFSSDCDWPGLLIAFKYYKAIKESNIKINKKDLFDITQINNAYKVENKKYTYIIIASVFLNILLLYIILTGH